MMSTAIRTDPRTRNGLRWSTRGDSVAGSAGPDPWGRHRLIRRSSCHVRWRITGTSLAALPPTPTGFARTRDGWWTGRPVGRRRGAGEAGRGLGRRRRPAAGRASVKAAGVVVDDTAVTPAYVHGLAAERELPIIKRIATGSLRNKLLFILPAALLLSEFVPDAGRDHPHVRRHLPRLRGRREDHPRPAPRRPRPRRAGRPRQGPDAEATTVSGAIRTDFILSAEIMVIALKEVHRRGFVSRGRHPRGRRRADHRRRLRRGGADREDGRRRPAAGRAPSPPVAAHRPLLVTGMPKLLACCRWSAPRPCSGSAATSCSSAPTSWAGHAVRPGARPRGRRCTTWPASAACSPGW